MVKDRGGRKKGMDDSYALQKAWKSWNFGTGRREIGGVFRRMEDGPLVVERQHLRGL